MRKALILSFILLTLLALGVTPMLAQDDSPALSPAVQPVGCPGAPVPQLVIGGTGYVAQTYSTLWVDPSSAASYKRMLSANGDIFTVVDGPFCAGGPYNWYTVTHTDSVTGITYNAWITEGTGSAYWVMPGDYPAPPVTVTPVPDPVTPVPPAGPQLPPRPVAGAQNCPGAPAFRLSVGSIGTPADVYQTLWVNPYSTAVHLLMYSHDAFADTYEVLDGPFCHRAYNWYLVRHTQTGTQGFITEGTGNAYWAQPIGVAAPEATEEPAS